jgi:pyruvate/2-oxoglutarate/acetoin dehydrogenase E1 component
VRVGGDVTIVSYSNGRHTVVAAAEMLAKTGIEADVIDLRSVYPLDITTVLASVRRTGRLVLLDEAPRFGSLAAQIAAQVQEQAFWYLDAPIAMVTAPQSPIPHSPDLVDALVPSAADVVAAVQRVVS